MVTACAEHGASVFMEKPMCPSLEEADAIVAACERAHVKCAIAHQTRYSPRVARVKELLAEGAIGELIEIRGRGKEDRRGGGEDLMVLGTHVMDLTRHLAGDAKWCMARVFDSGEPVAKAHVRDGAEGIGPLAGDTIDAMYGLSGNVRFFFSSHRPKDQAGSRFGIRIAGSRGMIDLTTGGLPPTYLAADPTWCTPRSGKEWVPITSAGLGKPEPLADGGLHLGNVLIAKDLIRAIEEDRQPMGSMYDGRAALEMILAIYESHRLGRAVDLPLANRKHPLSLMA
jgi:predicted dehydrogenase